MRQLKLTEHLSEKEKRYAVEAALLLGFQSETAVFPVASKEGDIRVPSSDEELLSLWKAEERTASSEYALEKNQRQVFELDFRKKQGLENIFSKGMFLKDENRDLLPDQLDVKLILPANPDIWLLTAACNLAFRLGMETTAYEGSILAEEGYEGNVIIFEYGEQAEVTLEELPGAVHVHIRGDGEELCDFTSLLCEKFPLAGGNLSWRDVLMEQTDDLAMRGADGQLAYLSALQKEHPEESYILYGSPEITEEQKQHFPETKIFNHKSGRKVYEHTYELTWEVDVFEQILKEKVCPFLHEGDSVKIEGALSEDKEVRTKLTDKVRKAVEDKGAKLKNAQIICAYKQGFSWMDEVVIPEIRGQRPDKVEIFFKPFLPEGQTEWLDENGATPSYHNLEADNPDKWYDLPIRFLQELYPVEDLLTKQLGITRDQVIFSAYEGEEDLTYLCRVSGEGTGCREYRYLVRYSERPYLDEYPQMGKVHPSSGYIRVWINGKERVNEFIPTDVERVWNIYQEEVLPQARRFIERKNGGEIREDMQPFFQQLLLDVSVSEPDYRVGCREDLISSLDALHEDLYFVGSDYFKNYGIQKANILLDAPGLILPQIHNREGVPVFRVTLYERMTEVPCILNQRCHDTDLLCSDIQPVAKQMEREQVSLWVSRIFKAKERIGLEIQARGVSGDVLEAYAGLFADGVLESSHSIAEDYGMRYITEDGTCCEVEAHPVHAMKKKKITEIDLHENELIGYEAYREIIEELKEVEGIEVFRTARSYLGRELYAIWLKPRYEGYLSMTKRLTRCPSEIINARHHANEVSSTNASFILLKKLLTEECYRELPEKLNLILVPMENVDGAAIHYELQKEHPYWKFHVARFNAIGKEFYHHHFRQDTIHSEAMGLTRLYEKYVPDMIVDNHGVPSHEWEQQFSGYTSPSYKGFWLPRSLLYGYFWYVTDKEYEGNYPVNKKMEDVIADRIAEDEEMTRWNHEWSAQFEKYAHAWMPKLFPANYYKDMINYWIPFPYDAGHRYPSIRFPWITTVAYTSEVADETAQGEYLNLCARAHVAHDEATLQMLMGAQHRYRYRCECREGQIFAEYLRQRPMVV